MPEENKNLRLKIENVSKVFAKVESDQVTHALQDVSVEMSGGEFVSLVGPSGCGKSTILRLVAGLITPTLGRVTVNDEEISGPSPSRGLVFQNPTLFPWLTAEKNISFSLDLRGDDKGKAEKVEHMLEITGLTQFRHASGRAPGRAGRVHANEHAGRDTEHLDAEKAACPHGYPQH